MRLLRIPSLLLAALLQFLPLVRTVAVINEALSPIFAIVLRWTAFTAASMGGLNAVSGASTTVISPASPYQLKATNGVPFLQSLLTGPETAHYWSISPALPSGLSLIGVSGSQTWFINGTPTAQAVGTWTGTLTAMDIKDTQDPQRRVSVTLTIDVVDTSTATKPTIQTPPSSQTVNAGANASLTVVANGTAPLTYQWRKNGSTVGSNSSTLTFNPVAGSDAGSYDVIVSNSAGSVTSAPPAVLTVVVPPTINTQPIGQTGYVGGSATFTVSASSSVPMTYQWRKGGVNVGGNSATLTINPLTANDAGSYDVLVSNQAGSTPSSAVMLTVSSPPSLQLQLDTVQPASGPRAIRWQAAAGKTYTLQRRDNFLTDVWHDIGQTNVTASGTVQLTDTTAGGVNVRFYRIRIQ